jgi:subtilase family serine protease
MQHMQVGLRLPTEKQAELERLLQEVQDPKSSNYRKWLTPQQFGQEFSLAPEDVQTIARWLRSEGFKINATNPTSIDFSGTAGQVRHTFNTEIHYLDVKGVRHIANMHAPQIPAALAPAIYGVVSLNDFGPHPRIHWITPNHHGSNPPTRTSAYARLNLIVRKTTNT